MDIQRITEESLDYTYEIARSRFAGLIHQHLSHESIPDTERWNLDGELAKELLDKSAPKIGLRIWTRSFVNVLAYAGHYNLTDRIISQGLGLFEAGGVDSGDYVRGLPDESFYNAQRTIPKDKQIAIFGTVAGRCLWNIAFPYLSGGRLRDRGFYPRPGNHA